MSIFKIVKNEGQTKVAVVKKSDEEAVSDKDEMKQAMAVVGESPTENKQEPGKTGEVPEKVNAFSVDSEKDQDVVIKIDGPLGRVFTEALNTVLALEGMSAFPLEEMSQVSQNAKVIHIHALDEDMLMTGDLVQISNEISRQKDDLFVLAVESSDMKPRVYGKKTMAAKALLGEMTNCQIHYTLQGAVRKAVLAIKGA